MKSRCGIVFASAIAGLALSVLTVTAKAQQFNQWSDWRGTSLASIQYRCKLGPYEGEIQFRNTSSKDVSINYSIWEPGADHAEKGTAYINANDTDGGHDFSDGATGRPPERVDVQIK